MAQADGANPAVAVRRLVRDRIGAERRQAGLRDVSTVVSPRRLGNGGSAPAIALVVERAGGRRRPAPGAAENGWLRAHPRIWCVVAAGPAEKLAPDAEGAMRLTVGDVVEGAVEPAQSGGSHPCRHQPAARGRHGAADRDPATAPAEARPSAPPTEPPSWVSFGDDRACSTLTTGRPRATTASSLPRAGADRGQLHPAAGRG